MWRNVAAVALASAVAGCAVAGSEQGGVAAVGNSCAANMSSHGDYLVACATADESKVIKVIKSIKNKQVFK
ncbi:Uncharacterised protein [Serratia quinivorans]|nr:Uncharacterised protein [Serratia quinivorans]